MVYELMKTPLIIDTRNIFTPSKAHLLGFRYKGIGINNNIYDNVDVALKNII